MANLENYEPHRYITENYGDEISGTKLLNFVKENFSDRVDLPEGAKYLKPS